MDYHNILINNFIKENDIMITSLFNKTFRNENVEHKEIIKSKGNEKYLSSSIKQYKEAVDVSSEEISRITIRDILNISIKFCWGIPSLVIMTRGEEIILVPIDTAFHIVCICDWLRSLNTDVRVEFKSLRGLINIVREINDKLKV